MKVPIQGEIGVPSLASRPSWRRNLERAYKYRNRNLEGGLGQPIVFFEPITYNDFSDTGRKKEKVL